MKRFFGWAFAAITVASATSAHAVPSVFTPRTAPDGGVEFYVAAPLEAKATSLPALADVALKAVIAAVPEAAAITVKFAQNAAELTVAEDRAGDPAVVDRALGAVFFTLRSVGFEDVRLGGAALDASSFTRAAQAITWTVPALLLGERARDGFVHVGKEILPVGAFYSRLDSVDRALQLHIRKLIAEGRPEVRLALVQALDATKIRDKEGVLIPRLTDTDGRVRKAAVALLAKNPSADAQKALAGLVDTETDNTTRLDAVRILVASGRKEFSKYLLLDKLSSSDLGEVKKAAKELAATKDVKFASGLAGLFSHPDAGIRDLGVSLVAELGQWQLLAGALALESVPAATRESAATVTADKGDAASRATALGWLVGTGTTQASLAAAATIAAGPVTGTADGLRKGLGRPEQDIRLAAAKAAAAIKDPATLEALGAASRDAADPASRAAFDEAVMAIVGAQPLDQALAIAKTKDDTVRALAVRALVGFAGDAKPSPKVTGALREALKDSQLPTRQAAATALSKIADGAIAGDLIALQADGDPTIRAAVVRGVARAGVPNADTLVVKALDDNEPEVKEAALEAVRERKIEAGLDKARWLVTHRRPEVRRAAMAALVTIAKPASPALFDIYSKAMMDEDEGLRIHALDGLKAWPANDQRALTAIGTPLIDERAPKTLQLKALEILVNMGGIDVVEHVVRGLFIEDQDVKLATLAALETLKSDKAVRPLQEFMLREQNPEIRARVDKLLEIL